MSERQQYRVEFPVQAKPELVFNYMTDPSGLAAWFADDVTINGDQYTFYWEGSEEGAKLVKRKPHNLVKYKWTDREEEEYLTFEIQKDDLTNDTAIVVYDYDEEDEIEEAKLMWESAIEQLKGTIGG
jgi:uncharacterized protein YndB with AHSA1/START domain